MLSSLSDRVGLLIADSQPGWASQGARPVVILCPQNTPLNSPPAPAPRSAAERHRPEAKYVQASFMATKVAKSLWPALRRSGFPGSLCLCQCRSLRSRPNAPAQELVGGWLPWPLLTKPGRICGGKKPLPGLPRAPNPRGLKVTFLDFSGRPTGLYYSICTQSGGQSGCRPHATAGEAGGVEWCGVGLSSLEIGGNEGLLRKDHRGRPGISWVLGPVPFCRQCLWPIAL